MTDYALDQFDSAFAKLQEKTHTYLSHLKAVSDISDLLEILKFVNNGLLGVGKKWKK